MLAELDGYRKVFQEDDVNYPDKEEVYGAYKRLFGVDYHKEERKLIADYGDCLVRETPRARIVIAPDGDEIWVKK